MPVSSPLTPKSVLRHRPLDSDHTLKEKPTVIRASRPALSTKKMVPPVACLPQKTVPIKKVSSHINLTSLGIGMMVAIVAVLLGQLLLGWVSTTWDDLRYGYPRTYQTDAFTGGERGQTASHFIVLNLRGHIEILEQLGGDPTKTKIYIGPQIAGPGADRVPVTLQFIDPHHTHSPDMVVQFQGTQVVFHNVHGVFQPVQS